MDWAINHPLTPQILSLWLCRRWKSRKTWPWSTPGERKGWDEMSSQNVMYQTWTQLCFMPWDQLSSPGEERSSQLMGCGPHRAGSGQKAPLVIPSRTPHASLCNLICNQLQVITHCLSSIGTRNPWENNELQLMTIRDYCLIASLIAHPSTGAIEHPPPQSTTENKN